MVSSSRTNTQDQKYLALSQVPVGRLLWQYALPAIIAMVASSLYNMVDGIFVGQALGETAISALALTNPIMAITAAVGAMVGMGGASLMSVKLGQRDYKAASAILGNVVVLNLLLGTLLGAVLLGLLRFCLLQFGASTQTLPYAQEYMHIILLGNTVTHLYFGLNAQLRSTNRPQVAMYLTFGTVLINALLDALFIFVLGWGIAGAAWATVLAQLSMLLGQIYLFTRKNELVALSPRALRLRWRLVSEILLIGLPQLLMNTCAALVSVLIMRSMAQYGDDTAIGAYGIVGRLVMVTAFVILGLNQGMQPILGYNYGAQRYDRVLAVLRLTLIVATGIMTLSFCLFFFFSEVFVRLFVTDRSLVFQQAVEGLKIIVLLFPFLGMQIVSSALFQSIKQPAKSIFLSLTRQLLFLVPLLYVLPHCFDHPLRGVWAAMPISDAASMLLALVLLYRQYRKFQQQAQQQQQNSANTTSFST